MTKDIKSHPWRICPIGSYYVRAHYKIINGKKVFWNAHCRKSKNKKEILTSDEILEISKKFGKHKLKMPKAYNFTSTKGNKYDLLIAGWVKFWADIFNVKSNITVDFVKVLIMTESSFRNKVKTQTRNNTGKAVGLMQITRGTYSLLQNEKELRNYHINIPRKDLENPSINICTGIRWLFRKRAIAKYYLKNEPNQLQLAEEYKGIRNDKSVDAQIQRDKFKEKMNEYKKAKVK